jgi:hypothetical protein
MILFFYMSSNQMSYLTIVFYGLGCKIFVIITLIVKIQSVTMKFYQVNLVWKQPENCENRNDPELVQRNGGLNQILKRQTSRFHYGSKFTKFLDQSYQDVVPL